MATKDPVEFRLYDTDLTSVLGIVPAKSMNLFLLLNEPGSGEVSIPLNSRMRDQIGSDMFIETKYRGGVRGGFFVENIGGDIVNSGEGEGQVVSISGGGALVLLDDAIVWSDGTGAASREFVGTRAGILIELIEEAKLRGTILNLDYDFTATTDSDSEAWEDADDEPLVLNVGTSLLDVVRRIAKVGTDFSMTPDGSGSYILSAYKNGIGEDKSSTVYFRVGVNCEEISNLEAGGEIRNALQVKYKGGFTQVKDDTSIGLRRRREKLYDVGFTARVDNAITFGAAELQSIKDPKKQITLRLHDGKGPRVFVDYGLGDRVTLDIEGVEVDYRVRGLRCAWDGEKFATVVVDLNSLILENEIRMSQDIAWLKEQWTNAHDAGLLEVSYWAAIGDPNVDYQNTGMINVGNKLYVVSGNYLLIYDILNGGWQRIEIGYSARVLVHIAGTLYISGFYKVFTYEIATGTLTDIADVFSSGNPPLSQVSSMVAIGTKIYMAGLYDSIGSLSTANVVEYDTLTDTWADLGEGSGVVHATLMTDGTNLFLGRTNTVRKWDTSSWSTVGTYPVGSSSILTMTMYGTNILAGGAVTGGIYEWDGVTWELFGGGVDDVVRDIKVYLTDVYVTGGFTDRGNYIAKYSGDAWWELEGGLDDDGTDLLLYESSGGLTVYVAGNFTKAGDKEAQGIAAYFNSFEALADYLESSSSTFNMAEAIHNAIAKTSLVANDEFGFWDSISQRLRKITWANVLLTIKAYADNLYVALTGNQTVAGIKTFSSFPVTPSSDPSSDYEVANKKYVDDNAGGGTPAGSDTEIQFNDSGAFGASADFKRASDGTILIGQPTGISTTSNSIHQTAADGVSLANILATFGTGVASFITFLRGRGTLASPTAVQSNDVLGRIRGRAYDDAGSIGNTSAEIDFVANQNHTPSAHGTRIELYTTPNGSTTPVLGVSIDNDGQLILHEYGSATFAGTLAKLLGVDALGNVIETDPVSDIDTLTANRTYYVRTDGNDSNTGLIDSSGGAFLTAAKARAVVATINKNGYDILIQFGAGTWNESFEPSVGLGEGETRYKGTLTLVETATSATVAAGSGATKGTVTKTGQFTGDNHSMLLAYFHTDDAYRVIDSNTANVLTLVDNAPSSTTQDVSIYSFGTIINYVEINSSRPVLEHIHFNGNGTRSLTANMFQTFIAYSCRFDVQMFLVTGGGNIIQDCVFYTNAATVLLGVGDNGNFVNYRCFFKPAHTSASGIVYLRGGGGLFYGGVVDGSDGGAGEATYGIRAFGGGKVQLNATGYTNPVIRNCDIGVRAESNSAIVGTASVTYSGNTTNESADAASYGYID